MNIDRRLWRFSGVVVFLYSNSTGGKASREWMREFGRAWFEFDLSVGPTQQLTVRVQ